ncbi:UNVERIFIED_CONTAM: Floral homeotic protein DEFICIENS [Sesamum calycinum]|uniref:Floral homeotic protein DEFICIENS n=1 Tax=Sesamum calycinum TaxID=2727403 RepID=A0AAW2QMJ4_9LAMI
MLNFCLEITFWYVQILATVQGYRQPDRTSKKKDARQEDPQYGLVENEGDYNSVLGFPNGGPRIIALRLPPNHHPHHHHHHPTLHSGGGASDLTTFALLE